MVSEVKKALATPLYSFEWGQLHKGVGGGGVSEIPSFLLLHHPFWCLLSAFPLCHLFFSLLSMLFIALFFDFLIPV